MVRLRDMDEGDIDAVSALRVRGWQVAYAGLVPQDHLDGMSAEEDARRRRAGFASSRGALWNLVAVDEDDVPVGWICFGPYRGVTDATAPGEVYALYVEPALMGRGIGRALLQAVHQHTEARRFATFQLWVLRDNARARRFYAAAGYAADGATESDMYGETAVQEVRYRRSMAPRGL
ncbi:L-amino acid N-acyltransferase YncA [Streptomyces sp. 2132.2]|uniref:GNAT family N-acetyltransferase n=1 Tax=Streptomyces sp. 2132.2 TaxID=2485161 RepID=UPI000F476661|nr:GNAT family N-acetyltransferase [Streptomyces sp. 2132.2]ROQ88932.1 L-amino acid N-acyltransferase YncA [Streptomyces sp. 2132.2]